MEKAVKIMRTIAKVLAIINLVLYCIPPFCLIGVVGLIFSILSLKKINANQTTIASGVLHIIFCCIWGQPVCVVTGALMIVLAILNKKIAAKAEVAEEYVEEVEDAIEE